MAARIAADSTVGNSARSEVRILGEVLHWWRMKPHTQTCPPSRMMRPEDSKAASPRWIASSLSPVSKAILRRETDSTPRLFACGQVNR